MRFAHTTIFVPNVAMSLLFFEEAFGLRTRLHDVSGLYGEMDTGTTTLAFAAHELAENLFPGGHVRADISSRPLGVEIGLVTDDIEDLFFQALLHGATQLASPQRKPWGQTVAYVRTPEGILVAISSPMTTAPVWAVGG